MVIAEITLKIDKVYEEHDTDYYDSEDEVDNYCEALISELWESSSKLYRQITL